MKIRLNLKCNIKDRLELNLQRNCVLTEGLRPNIKVENINYIAFVERVYEKDALYCQLIALFDSEYSVKNYKNIFTKDKNILIMEGSKVLAECIILNIEEV